MEGGRDFAFIFASLGPTIIHAIQKNEVVATNPSARLQYAGATIGSSRLG
jgi:hypothetical protein